MSKWEEKELSEFFSQYNDVFEKKYAFTTICDFIKQHNSIKKVLDLGCGSGALIPFLTSIVPQVIGADISKYAIELAKERYKESGAIFTYPTELHHYTNDIPFDTVISSFVLCTLKTEDSYKAIFRQVNSYLVKHGYYMTLDFNLDAFGIDFGPFKTGEAGKSYRDGETLLTTLWTKTGKPFSFNDTYWSLGKRIACAEEAGFSLHKKLIPHVPNFKPPFIISVFKKEEEL
ncbi:class I SAM-dependent methyltransferase [Xenorhabdus sp. SGI246]|uniref:class I SAM-dependent methyltransferase n=1 Tax=Xenorhabdus sp. SGI246 TaxID=3158263 RepID=UPI00349F3406